MFGWRKRRRAKRLQAKAGLSDAAIDAFTDFWTVWSILEILDEL